MIFYVGGPAQDMADGTFQNIHFKSVFLVALFVLSLWSPALSVETPADDLQSQPIIAQSAPYAPSPVTVTTSPQRPSMWMDWFR